MARARTFLHPLIAVVLLVAAGWVVFVMGILWAADFDPNSDGEVSGSAGISAVLLALGMVCALTIGLMRRSWRALSVALAVAAVIAAVAWLPLLG